MDDEEGKLPTIILRNERLVDDVMIIYVDLHIVILHLNRYGVYHGNEPIIVAWRSRSPILPEVSEHVHVIS